MKIITNYEACPLDARGAAIALGNFDGVHRGHQEIIRITKEISRNNSIPSAVMTFEPHPASIFKPNLPPNRITPFPAKSKKISELGIDIIFAFKFDEAFSKITAQKFVDNILINKLAAKSIVIGYDFIFGHNREGNAKFLEQKSSSSGFSLTIVEPVKQNEKNGEIYSSTKIRQFLQNGEIEKANNFLGYNYFIYGKVEHGEKRGREIGYPTANIYLTDHLRPKFGVYQVRVKIDKSDKWLPAIASIGCKPTYDDNREVLEVFIFDFNDDIYNKEIQVEFLKFIREEIRFSDTPSLMNQIKTDCEMVFTLFNK